MQLNPEFSPRPDKDTAGISGTPNIVQTIFSKIDDCSIFIADLTFIDLTSKGKHLSNPNVLFELGYAVKTIGWERIILVLNIEFGLANKLPFDLMQHRWPITYKIKSGVMKEETAELETKFIEAFSSCQNSSIERVKRMTSLLDTDSLKLMASNHKSEFIEMPMPAGTMGEVLTSTSRTASFRRLIDLGAIRVVDTPYIGYGWTHDGKEMIKEISKTYPKLLETI